MNNIELRYLVQDGIQVLQYRERQTLNIPDSTKNQNLVEFDHWTEWTVVPVVENNSTIDLDPRVLPLEQAIKHQ